MALLVLFNLTIVPFMGLIPIYVRAAYGGGTGMAGTVASAQGLGAIVGGIAVTVLAARYSRSTVMRGLVFVLPTMLIAYAVAPSVRWLLPAAFLLGGCASAMFITSSAIVQRDAPPASRGRIVSIMQAAMGVCYGIGLLVIGSIGDLTNLHIAFTVGAGLMVVGFTALTLRSRQWRRAVDGAPIAVINELVPA